MNRVTRKKDALGADHNHPKNITFKGLKRGSKQLERQEWWEIGCKELGDCQQELDLFGRKFCHYAAVTLSI